MVLMVTVSVSAYKHVMYSMQTVVFKMGLAGLSLEVLKQ